MRVALNPRKVLINRPHIHERKEQGRSERELLNTDSFPMKAEHERHAPEGRHLIHSAALGRGQPLALVSHLHLAAGGQLQAVYSIECPRNLQVTHRLLLCPPFVIERLQIRRCGYTTDLLW